MIMLGKCGRRRCCSGGLWDTQWKYIYHEYVKPAPFAGRSLGVAGVWEPPSLGRPDWCDKLVGINIHFGKLANHPCTYWTAEYGPERTHRRNLLHVGDVVGEGVGQGVET